MAFGLCRFTASDAVAQGVALSIDNPSAENPGLVSTYSRKHPGWSEFGTSDNTGVATGNWKQHPSAPDGKQWFWLDSRTTGGLYQEVGTIAAKSTYTLNLVLGVPDLSVLPLASDFQFGLFAGNTRPTTTLAVGTDDDVTVGSGETQAFSLSFTARPGAPYIGQNLFISMEILSPDSRAQQVYFDHFTLEDPTPLVQVDLLEVGDVSNAYDTIENGWAPGDHSGSVSNVYSIGKFEVSNTEYTAFLNAVDPAGANALALYNPTMGTDMKNGGITLTSGNSNGSKYAVKTGFAKKPVVYVSFYDAMRFCNWLGNGAVAGADTEDGAYTLEGGTAVPTNGATVEQNEEVQFALPTEDEWYKAAYHQPAAKGGDEDHYWLYPTMSNSHPKNGAPPGVAPAANCPANYRPGLGAVTEVGAYTTTVGYYGTFDMAGNVYEWIETRSTNSPLPGAPILRSGSWAIESDLRSRFPSCATASYEEPNYGFRVRGTRYLSEEGTIFVYPDIIRDDDPTAFKDISSHFTIANVTMFDREALNTSGTTGDWINVDAYVFDLTYDDGISAKIRVRQTDYRPREAFAIAREYAENMGRLPACLRKGVKKVNLMKGDREWGGNSDTQSIDIQIGKMSRGYQQDGNVEETLAHECAHASLDGIYYNGNTCKKSWETAQEEDNKFISEYAWEFPCGEDVAESFSAFIALRYRSSRITKEQAMQIWQTIPSRIKLFEDGNLDMHPLD